MDLMGSEVTKHESVSVYMYSLFESTNVRRLEIAQHVAFVYRVTKPSLYPSALIVISALHHELASIPQNFHYAQSKANAKGKKGQSSKSKPNQAKKKPQSERKELTPQKSPH